MLILKLHFLIFIMATMVFPAISMAFSSFSIESGYQQSKLKWSIAGDSTGKNPNILSELTWDDLEIFELKIKGEKILGAVSNHRLEPFLRGKAAYGIIHKGKNRDSDYLGDNRTKEFSRSNNAADEGHTLDLSVGGGVRYPLIAEQLFLLSAAGYSYNEQNLTIQDGVQTIPFNSPLEELDSRYETQWYGPWCGLGVLYQPTPQFRLNGSFEYHWATYHAVANWNLREDLAHPASFVHDADGTGLVYELGAEYLLAENVALSLSGVVQKWQTDTGRDQIFYADGGISDTRLNEVEWDSVAVSLGLRYRF